MENRSMDFAKAVGWAKGHRNVLVVAALVFVLAGFDLLVNRPKDLGVQWFSLPLLGAGLGILVLVLWPTARPGPRPVQDTLARRLLWWATGRGRLAPLFPVAGIAVVVADLAFNAFVSSTPELLVHDQAVLFFGGILIAYPYVPGRYARERDFVFLFVLVLVAILVIPLAFLRLFVGDPNASVDVYSTFALAPQTSGILNLIGVQNTIVYGAAEGAPGLAFRTASGLDVQVYITSACSGIYSFAIFTSAFTAFVLTEQRRLTRRVAAFFVLGVLLAYIANVLRMVVIVYVGYAVDTPETGLQSLLVAHSNAGWIIFLLWIALFWVLLFRFLPMEKPAAASAAPGPRRRGAFCGICAIVLTPAIPATRCACGKMYHVECLDAEGRCPNCSEPAKKAAETTA